VAANSSARAGAAFQQALVLHRQSRLEEARIQCQKTLRLQPRHFKALHLLGTIALQSNDALHAVELLGNALRIDPGNAEAHNDFGSALSRLQQTAAAIASYDRAIALKPDLVAAHYNRGNELLAQRQLTAAIESYEQAIALKPDYTDAYNNRGNALVGLHQYESAIESYERATSQQAGYVDAWHNCGIALQGLKRYQAAIESFEQAIALNPKYAAAFNQRGKALSSLGRYEAAVASCEQALALKAGDPSVYDNLGNALHGLGQYEVAIDCYDKAIALYPDYADALFDRAVTLGAMKQYEAAVVGYERAIALKPDNAIAHNNLGTALAELKNFAAAGDAYNRAIALDANYAEAWHNRGHAQQELRQYEAAVQCYERAIALKTDYADAYYALGIALWKLGRHEAAVVSYERAMALKPTIRFMYGMRLLSEMQLCDWSTRERDLQQLRSLIERSEPASGPFAVLVAADEPALQLRSAQILVRELFAPDPSLGAIAPRPRHERIRVGYFSADFHNHATLHLMAGLFEAHDRSRFECTAFSFGAPSQDGMRARLLAASEHFLDVREKSDRQIAQLARELQVDIAVDLKGFTEGHRTGIFALRAAPLQLSYLGYPGTMGAPYIDYLIADRTLVPEHSQHHYSEKIIYLPDSYQINDSQRPIAPRTLSRAQCALPPTGFVFCCFNNCYKITPSTFDCWMRLLSGVQGSVLWLLEDNAVATRNLKREASSRGVDPDRLLFAPRLPLPEHLARHTLADLFLDTLPCNAHTTASDALWATLPVLSCPGEGFAARVAASVLHALDLPELIASSPQHYEQLALELALNPQRLTLIRERLAAQRLSSPLFNTLLTTRHIESAYSLIYERYLASYPTDHIVVGHV
jgi:protein O-GlcNAc transferase